MRRLHLDIISGISGDMLMGALLHLGAPLAPLTEAVQRMGLGNIRIESGTVEVSGIQAMRFAVIPPPGEHHHRTMAHIQDLLQNAGLPGPAKERAEATFRKLAEAEGRVHGRPVDQVTFHEVGAFDSIADIVGCALALDHLAPDQVTSSPPLLGRGTTECQHGMIPIPAPATVQLLLGIQTIGTTLAAELTTPTGAALVASQVDRIGAWGNWIPERVGYGAGSRRLPDRPNLLRALVGQAVDDPSAEEVQIECNLDDMNPEHFEHLMERLFEQGAHDVWLEAIIMKKSRPGTLLRLLCTTDKAAILENVLFAESTTIGTRRSPVQRRKLARRIDTVQTRFGPVRMKVATEGKHVHNVAPEYEDCRARAIEHGVPLKTVYAAAQFAWSETNTR